MALDTDGFGKNYGKLTSQSGVVITYAPAAVGVSPPIYTSWTDIASIINQYQGVVTLLIDNAGGSFSHVPNTSIVDGRGRLRIIGVGPAGEAELVIDDGGQLKNVYEWQNIVVRGTPNVRPSILYDLGGMAVKSFDASFLFSTGTSTQPIIKVNQDSGGNAGNDYISMFLENAGFFNSHNPGNPVLVSAANMTLQIGITNNVFPSPWDGTIGGPASSSLVLQLDTTQPNISLPGWLGSITVNRIDDAANLPYVAASAPNWNNSAPATVKAALDRIAAKIGPIS